MNKYKLTGVGLGPGDPDLITVKGLKALQEAEIIFYPASKQTGEKITSFSLEILSQLSITANLIPLLIPMGKENREQYYYQAYLQIKKAVDSGGKVAVVSEGDLLFYSTFGYLLRYILKDKLDYELIPGIPAFIDAANKTNQVLVEGNEKLCIIARPGNFSEISKELSKNQTVVIMKMKVLEDWCEFIKINKLSFFYGEKLGTAQQFCTSNLEELKKRVIPYFSLLILYN